MSWWYPPLFLALAVGAIVLSPSGWREDYPLFYVVVVGWLVTAAITTVIALVWV